MPDSSFASAAMTVHGADPWSPPCRILGLPQREYFAIPAASSHFLAALLERSPLHAKQSLLERKPTKAKDLGTLAHLLVLEPKLASQLIVVLPAHADRRSNRGKLALLECYCEALHIDVPQGNDLDLILYEVQAMIEDSPLIFAPREVLDAAERMRDATMAKSIARVLFADGESEVTMLAEEPSTGVLCRIRADWMPNGHSVLVDVKTTRKIDYDGFARDAGNFNYHFQAAMYCCIEALVSRSRPKDFLFVIMENEPPYDVAIRKIGAKSLAAGMAKFERALTIYKLCCTCDEWPGVGYSWLAGDYEIEEFDVPNFLL